MQPLTASPRDAYTAAQMQALLVAPDLQVDYGCEQLDAALNLVDDISDNVSLPCTVARDNYAAVHGTLTLTISQQLAWGYDRVRPYVLLSSPTVGVADVRWNQGVYLMTTPVLPLDPLPATFTVTGFDQIYLLQDNIGDSYSVPAGANVLTAVRAVFTAAGITAPVLLDSSAIAKALATPITCPLTSSTSPTWLQVINQLLAAISYQGIWCDQDGAFRSGPYVDPALRPSEWTFKVGDPIVGVVAAPRTVANDVWSAPNWWRFIMNGLTVPPVEGVGQYTQTNPTIGPSSIAAVGLRHAPPVYLDAVDQASLVAQGSAIAAAAMRVTEVITAALSPFPAAWHFDVSTYSDPALGPDQQMQCRSWSLPLDGGSDMTYLLESVT